MTTYIDHYKRGGLGGTPPKQELHSWDAHTRRTLRWLYGPDYEAERAAMTQADLAAWRRLGSRDAA
jgi:hypothetical protein